MAPQRKKNHDFIPYWYIIRLLLVITCRRGQHTSSNRLQKPEIIFFCPSYYLSIDLYNLYYRSCYRTAVAMTTCVQSTLGAAFSLRRRRKRSNEVLIQNPILKIGDKIVPFMDYIDATKVSLPNKYNLSRYKLKNLLPYNIYISTCRC